jgi:rfaE bifunctional protein kinase chain/domain
MIKEFNLSQSIKTRLNAAIEHFTGKKILLIGDIGIDEYVIGEVRRISPEAPVPVLEVESEDTRLGLAANVAHNIASLGGTPVTVSVIGQDQGAITLKNLFKQNHLDFSHLLVDTNRSTTRKTRIMARHHHVVRVDYETRQFLTSDIQTQLIQKIESLLPKCDAIILQDYGKGVVTQEVITATIGAAKKNGKKVYVDPHRTHRAEFYAGCDLIKPNYDEALALTGIDPDDLKKDPNRTQIIGETLKARSRASQVVMTQGKDGMTIFNDNGTPVRVLTFAKEVFDVTGAGDTVIAALTLGCVTGMPLEEACVLANFAAGIVVGKVGCVPCKKNELLDAIAHFAI